MSKTQELSSFIWNICDDVLRGLFKPYEYGDVILPFVVLRRLDCVLEPQKDEMFNLYEEYKDKVKGYVSDVLYDDFKKYVDGVRP